MSRIAYVDGRYSRLSEASVHIEDRGFQFADGVYEVWAVFGGRLADSDGHFERLDRSLGELRIGSPMGRPALTVVLKEVVRRNKVRDGLVYLQVTRGSARRDHAFPVPAPRPTVVATARSLDIRGGAAKAAKGVGVITMPDIRWGRCDIKSVSLLPNILAKQAAFEAGAYEAWLVDSDGYVTEGSSTNAWIVDANGVLRTRTTNDNILRGVTRRTLVAAIEAEGLSFSDASFTVAEAKSAQEAFITAASALVMPVVSIDGEPVGDGRPGPLTQRLRNLYAHLATACSI